MHPQNKKLKKCIFSDADDRKTMADEKCDKSEVQNNVDGQNNAGILGSSSSSNDSNGNGRKDSKENRKNPPLIPILANHEQWRAWQQTQAQAQNPQPAGFDLKDFLERMPVPTIALTVPPLTMPFLIPQNHPGAASLPPLFPPISPGAAAEIAAKTGISCSQPPPPCPTIPFPILSPGLGYPRVSNAMPPPTPPIQKETVSAPPGISVEQLHQLLIAQSEQNSQLRKTVDELQSELSEYKRRVVMLETDFATVKSVIGPKTSRNETPTILGNERRSGPHQAPPSEMMKKLNYEKVFLKKVDYDIPILHKPDGQPAKKAKKAKDFLERLLMAKSDEATAVETSNASQKMSEFGSASSSKAPPPLNPDLLRLVKTEQPEM